MYFSFTKAIWMVGALSLVAAESQESATSPPAPPTRPTTLVTYTSGYPPGPSNHYGGRDSCHDCPGWCGDNEIQTAFGEECDEGLQNGQLNSGCTKDCKLVDCCGDGTVDYGLGEQCDDGVNNGKPWSSCSSNCTWVEPYCGNGITEWPEECDDGKDLNGTPWSHCTKDCKRKKDCGCHHPSVCGNGIKEPGEQCDDGWAHNGHYGSNCTSECKWCDDIPGRCGDGFVDKDEQCDDGDKRNGSPDSNCDATCHWKKTPPTCPQTCDPNPFNNRCTITTSCISYLDTEKNYCACRAGYRANGLATTDPRQFRLHFPGQDYRVFVAPGIECDQLCDTPHPGPDSCKEVPVQKSC